MKQKRSTAYSSLQISKQGLRLLSNASLFFSPLGKTLSISGLYINYVFADLGAGSLHMITVLHGGGGVSTCLQYSIDVKPREIFAQL